METASHFVHKDCLKTQIPPIQIINSMLGYPNLIIFSSVVKPHKC